jgi:hypothetical protein
MNASNRLFLSVACALSAAASTGTAIAANNPADRAGIQHNMYLSCLEDTSDRPGSVLTRLVELCGFNPGMPLRRFERINQAFLNIDPTVPLAIQLSGLRNRLTPYEFSFIERIDQIVKESESLDDAELRMQALEQEAIENLDHDSDNGEYILGGISVARHSLRYWKGHYDYARTDGPPRKKWWQYLLIAAGDVGGYLLSQDVGVAASASSTVNDIISN